MASISMQVIKRNGDREDVSFDKVLNRIQTAAAGLEVNPTLIAQRTLLRIHDGVKTSELDELAAQLSVSLMTTHPDYGTLAARLAITNHHQNTSDRFTDVVEALANQVIEKTGEHTSTVSQELIDLCRLHGDAINQKICHERDHLFDYFGFKTLEKLQYLLRDTKGKTLERPQYLLMRVSLALWGSISLERAFETYDLLSQKYFIHATPTNFNAGTPRQQLSSCFTENTLVHTLQGVKMIKDVAIGDQVVTHTGGVRPVVQLHKNLLADRPLFDIKLSGTPTMTVTGNHRLWSVSDEKEKWGMPAGWNTVEYLRVGDWVAIPNKKGGEAYVLDVKPFLDEYTSDGNNVSYRYDYSEPGRVTSYASWTKHFANERTVNSEKKGDSFNRYWVFDEDMMELMGIWYGDGCVFHGRRSDGGQSVRGINIVSFHNNHVLIDFVTAMLYEKLGVKHVTVRHDKNGMVTMSVNHHTIGHLFKAIFRSGFAGKRLPAFFHTLPKASITSFLAGIVSSDGCVTGTGSITVSLTNPPLVHDIFHLARSVGIPITMTLMHKKDAKATGRMTIPSDVVDGKIKKVYADNRIEIYESKKMWQQVRVIDGVTFMRINAKDHAQERPEYVYTLGVEEDHSYSVGGIVAENCFLISMKADSINGIYDTLKDCALISKYAGGIGLHIHNIRAKGSLIRGTNGTSNGIVPMLRNFNDTARYVDQCFTPDTLVTTETGPRPIADIKAGDRVLTHKGTYETVQKQVIHQYKGQMFAITLEGHDTPVRVTEEHPLLSLKAKGDSLETVLARVQMGVDAPDYLEVKELAVGDVTVFPQGPQGQKDQKSHGIITSIVPVEYDGPVYDFEVEGEHNYTVTHLGVAHNGGGKRNGSFAIYLEPWHADVEDFLKLKLNTGSEEERCRDLFYALWISDLFMERVETNAPWTLFCPSEAPGLADVYGDEFRALYERYEAEGRGRKQIDAQKLWFKILDAQIETGTPYLLFKDAANQKSNQKNVGTIKSSNLCVAPETYLLTDQGQQQISTLVGQTVRVWNGEDWSETVVHKTGENQRLITVFLSNGAQLTCTPYHKFLIRSGEYDKATIKDATRVEAKDLQPNMKLIKWNAPVLVGSSEFDFKEPYTHGFFCGDGNEFKNENKRIILCGEKKKLIPYLRLNTIGNEQKNGTIQAMIPKDLNKKFDVPLLASIECRVKWIAGLLDADAGVHRSNKNTDVIDLCGTEKEFLNNVRLLLLSLGVQSKVILAKKARTEVFPGGKEYHCKDLYHIPIGAESIYQLVTLGMVCHRLVFRHPEPARSCQQYVTVTSVMDTGRVDDTYCVNEPHNHAAVFNGILTGNCTEIMEYSSPEETSVCNLASLALPAYVNAATKTFDYAMLRKVVKVAIRNLNRVIDINYYPTPETERSNLRHRPVGLGVQGLADVFALMRVSWESEKAADLNQRIFEHIYYAAVESSCEIAAEDGPYSTFHGSPMSEGMFQYDMWGVTPLTAQGAAEDQLDWAGLKERVMVTGVRNSLLVAPMPTASTSQILGFNECIEPFTSNLYARRTLAGEFVVINRHLMKDLQKLDLWNEMMKQQIIARNGSIQGLDQIPESIQRLYKTSWEIKQKTLIDMAAARGAFICQSQSMNLFVGDPNYAKLTSMHFYSWKKGLKTGIYYLRTRAPVMAQKFTVDPELQREAQRSEQMRLLRKSSDADSECVMCGS